MRNGILGFQASRLKEARDARGLTQVALADLIGRASSSICRWETGDQAPELDTVERLSNALNVPTAFFLKESSGHGEHAFFFRSMASTTQAIRRRTRIRLRWAQDASLSLQDWVDLPDVDVPHLEVRDYREIQDEDIEDIADHARQHWGLSHGPISDLLLAIENAGICVVKEEVGSRSMDGVSNWSEADGRPYMLIARDRDTCVRSRMDAAHELGHLVLHRYVDEKRLKDSASFKEIERQAFRFAGAFLLPAESFGAEIWSPALDSLVALKPRWKASVGAMIKRCSDLGMLSDQYQTRLWKYYSSRAWRKREPLDDTLEPESPKLLSRSVQLLVDEGIRTREDLLTDFRLPASDAESLCGVPRGYLTQGSAEIVQVKPRRGRSESASTRDPSSDNVVRFPRR